MDHLFAWSHPNHELSCYEFGDFSQWESQYDKLLPDDPWWRQFVGLQLPPTRNKPGEDEEANDPFTSFSLPIRGRPKDYNVTKLDYIYKRLRIAGKNTVREDDLKTRVVINGVPDYMFNYYMGYPFQSLSTGDNAKITARATIIHFAVQDMHSNFTFLRQIASQLPESMFSGLFYSRETRENSDKWIKTLEFRDACLGAWRHFIEEFEYLDANGNPSNEKLSVEKLSDPAFRTHRDSIVAALIRCTYSLKYNKSWYNTSDTQQSLLKKNRELLLSELQENGVIKRKPTIVIPRSWVRVLALFGLGAQASVLAAVAACLHSTELPTGTAWEGLERRPQRVYFWDAAIVVRGIRIGMRVVDACKDGDSLTGSDAVGHVAGVAFDLLEFGAARCLGASVLNSLDFYVFWCMMAQMVIYTAYKSKYKKTREHASMLMCAVRIALVTSGIGHVVTMPWWTAASDAKTMDEMAEGLGIIGSGNSTLRVVSPVWLLLQNPSTLGVLYQISQNMRVVKDVRADRIREATTIKDELSNLTRTRDDKLLEVRSLTIELNQNAKAELRSEEEYNTLLQMIGGTAAVTAIGIGIATGSGVAAGFAGLGAGAGVCGFGGAKLLVPGFLRGLQDMIDKVTAKLQGAEGTPTTNILIRLIEANHKLQVAESALSNAVEKYRQVQTYHMVIPPAKPQ